MALVSVDGEIVRRVLVGRRPTAVVVGAPATGRGAQHLRRFPVPCRSARRVCPSHHRPGTSTRSLPADRGELLFFDAHLSRDGWLSCHSCHTDGHSNGLLADTLGDGTYGTPKRTLTLRGTVLTDPWAWNGSMQYLQDQIEKFARPIPCTLPVFPANRSTIFSRSSTPCRRRRHGSRSKRIKQTAKRSERGRMLFAQRLYSLPHRTVDLLLA